MIKIPHLIANHSLKEFNKKAASGGNLKTTPQRLKPAICMPKKTITNWLGFFFFFFKAADEISHLKHHDENVILKKNKTTKPSHGVACTLGSRLTYVHDIYNSWQSLIHLAKCLGSKAAVFVELMRGFDTTQRRRAARPIKSRHSPRDEPCMVIRPRLCSLTAPAIAMVAGRWRWKPVSRLNQEAGRPLKVQCV